MKLSTLLYLVKTKYRLRKFSKLRKKEVKYRKEFNDYANSPAYMSLTDESMDRDNFLYGRYENALRERRKYQGKVIPKPIEKVIKKGKEIWQEKNLKLLRKEQHDFKKN